MTQKNGKSFSLYNSHSSPKTNRIKRPEPNFTGTNETSDWNNWDPTDWNEVIAGIATIANQGNELANCVTEIKDDIRDIKEMLTDVLGSNKANKTEESTIHRTVPPRRLDR